MRKRKTDYNEDDDDDNIQTCSDLFCFRSLFFVDLMKFFIFWVIFFRSPFLWQV